MDPKHPPFAPEVFLREWDRKGLAWVSATLGEMLLRLLKIHHPTAFDKLSLTPPVSKQTVAQMEAEDRVLVKAEPVVALEPFDFKGAMRDARVAVGVGRSNTTLRVVPFADDKPAGMGEAISLERLDLLGAELAWATLGEIVLFAVARMHPDVFGHTPTWSRRWGD